MTATYDYVREGAEIYRRSFAIIRAESNLARFTPAEEPVVVRMVHACGLVELADDVEMSPDFAHTARTALRSGAPVLCDSKMVANCITKARLPASNPIVCTLDDARVPAIAAGIGNTRSAAAMELWRAQLAGSIVAIGNAPTALLEIVRLARDEGARPALVVGVPVGFVSAAESKDALIASGLPAIVARGRKGGSPVAVAILHALLLLTAEPS
jgi:precorrin-8X/cobalt-precorrin-8 methylmutase